MADVLVSARITQAKKDAAKGILASLGSSTSDLINSAFDYLLEEKTLPQTHSQQCPSIAAFERYLQESTIPIDWGEDVSDGNYRELVRRGKQDAYESLA